MKKFKFILLFCLFQVQPFSLQAAEFLITSEVKLMEKRRFFPPKETKIEGFTHLGEYYNFPDKIPYSDEIFYNPNPIKGGRPFCRIYMKSGGSFTSATFWYFKGKKRKLITSKNKSDYLSFGCKLN
jgi:hypothetical protein